MVLPDGMICFVTPAAADQESQMLYWYQNKQGGPYAKVLADCTEHVPELKSGKGFSQYLRFSGKVRGAAMPRINVDLAKRFFEWLYPTWD